VESAHYQLVDLEAPDTRASYCEPANRQCTERQRTQRESAEGQRTGGESMLLRDCEAHAPRQAGYVPVRAIGVEFEVRVEIQFSRT
jgi:hypothetical protein